MKKFFFWLIVVGVLLILVFAWADYFGLGKRGSLGAAQLLGIESGVALVLFGIGLLTVDKNRATGTGKSSRLEVGWILDVSPVTWAALTFLAIYVAFFISPVFFSKTTIHYFVKYVPDAWVTRIGFDVETTVTYMENWLVNGQSPYSDGVVPYSPLTLAIFAPLIILGYPAYYQFLTVVTFLCYVFAALLLPARISLKESHTPLILFALLGLFSYGFQFELERGQFNVIAFMLSLLAIYIYHYHHNLRYFAYLSLSLAIQLKIYPLVFIFMLIKDWRDWKGNIKRMAGLGLFNFSLLFVLGYQLFMDFMTTITARQLGSQSSRIEDLSIRGFIYDLATDDFGVVQNNMFSQHSQAVERLILILFGVCLFSIVAHMYRRNATGVNIYLLAVCTIGALIIPTASFDYKLPILTAPMGLVFSCLPAIQGVNKKIASIILIIIASAAYWSTLYPYMVKPVFMFRNFPALFVILLSVTTLYFLADGKSEIKIPDDQQAHRQG